MNHRENRSSKIVPPDERHESIYSNFALKVQTLKRQYSSNDSRRTVVMMHFIFPNTNSTLSPDKPPAHTNVLTKAFIHTRNRLQKRIINRSSLLYLKHTHTRTRAHTNTQILVYAVCSLCEHTEPVAGYHSCLHFLSVI